MTEFINNPDIQFVFVFIGTVLIIIVLGIGILLYFFKKSILHKIPTVKRVKSVLTNAAIPTPVKIMGLIISFIYILNPIDFLPDILTLFFGVGIVDDFAVISLIFLLIEKTYPDKKTKQPAEK